MECVYCESSTIKARMIAQNAHAFAFPTNIPITPGHVLIVPKRHVATFADLTDAEFKDLRALAVSLQNALVKLFGAEGFNMAFNQGPVAGQSIPHFHLHIVPRRVGDTGVTNYEPRKFLYRPGSREESPEPELLAVSASIRAALQ